jgi:hypothetical protein
MTDDEPTAREPALGDRDIARLRESVRAVASEDTFGGRFTLIGQAGSGGMGLVYEAKDRHSERRVAIKVITGLAGPTERARFAAEAEVLEKLDHPAIVDYVEHGLTRDGEPYLAMEWLVGESLAARLERGRLTVAETAILGERLADALEHAHGHGVVHRDLKPSNILLVGGKLEDAHLIDFGVAKMADKDLTHTGQIIGTPGYMAPEQVRGEKSVAASADLFALGCVLYKALTTRDAFGGQDVMEILARLLLEEPTPVEQLAPDVPPRLAHLIGSLLSKDPQRRLGDAAIACAEMRAIRAALAAHDTTELALKPEEVPAPPVPARAGARAPAWLVALAAGGVVIGLGTLAYVLLARDGGDDPDRCDAQHTAGCKAKCEQSNAQACYFHARWLHDRGRDHEAGRAADARACRLGETEGCYEGARSLLKLAKPYPPADARRALWLKEAEYLLDVGCKRGHSESCREHGKQLSKGVGMFVPDPPRAFALVEQACEANNVKACRVLPTMIADEHNGGTAELRDHARAVHAAACARLADLHCDR